jgi:hypothetical protein
LRHPVFGASYYYFYLFTFAFYLLFFPKVPKLHNIFKNGVILSIAMIVPQYKQTKK